uniref:Uncharacterized protein n=1 Tax=Anopheles culicifacies TaxID=139723 RepID=A0A182MJJ7_9DIPT
MEVKDVIKRRHEQGGLEVEKHVQSKLAQKRPVTSPAPPVLPSAQQLLHHPSSSPHSNHLLGGPNHLPPGASPGLVPPPPQPAPLGVPSVAHGGAGAIHASPNAQNPSSGGRSSSGAGGAGA